MLVGDGWDINSWDFCGGLVMPSPARIRLRWLRPHLLLVLLDLVTVVEEASLARRMDCRGLDWSWWGRGVVAVHEIYDSWVVVGVVVRDVMFLLLIIIHVVVVTDGLVDDVEGVGVVLVKWVLPLSDCIAGGSGSC